MTGTKVYNYNFIILYNFLEERDGLIAQQLY